MVDQSVSSESMTWDDLRGKVVMVTGASSGIGCKIVAAARRVDRLMSLCDEINGLRQMDRSGTFSDADLIDDVRAVAVELDVSAEGAAIEGSVKIAWEAFGRIDCLINNAGIRGNVRSPLELSEEEWKSTMRTNLTGSWLVAKYVCTHMRDANQGGSIINISSISGLNRGGLPGGLAYASSKAGVVTLTKVMAMEMGTHKIRVNSINPGIFSLRSRKVYCKRTGSIQWFKRSFL